MINQSIPLYRLGFRLIKIAIWIMGKGRIVRIHSIEDREAKQEISQTDMCLIDGLAILEDIDRHNRIDRIKTYRYIGDTPPGSNL
jgi:hypothetical protein